MAVQRWTLYDPATDETWTMPMNPKEAGFPGVEKTIESQNTLAPDGYPLVFEGRDQLETTSWSGVILSRAARDDFLVWAKKRNQLLLTNDYDEQFWIYIRSFKLTRRRAVNYEVRYDYTLDVMILDWPLEPG